MASSTWECSKCTFLNPPTQKSHCQICLSPSIFSSSSSPSSSSSSSRWSCNACTFSNPLNSTSCEMCGGVKPPPFTPSSPFSRFGEMGSISDEELDASIGSVFLPLQPCKRKTQDGVSSDSHVIEPIDHRAPKKVAAVPRWVATNAERGLSTIKILTYNIWFREDLEVHKRMKAVGDLIQQHSPDIICFQEVTPNIYDILRQSGWWEEYRCSFSNDKAFPGPYFCMQLSKLPVKAFSSIPFSNSIMGRELCLADIDVQGPKKLVVATSHLESPCPAPPKWDQMFSQERVAQAKEAINLLKNSHNTIFCGDMNWDDKLDGQFPLPDGWADAWVELRPKENGWTYDTKANKMLSANRMLQKRLDRFVCNLSDFKLSGIEMIGMEPLPGLSYCKEKKVRKELQTLVLPILPSDHFGLLLTVQSQ